MLECDYPVFYQDKYITLLEGDSWEILSRLHEGAFTHCLGQSPGYQMRDYGDERQVGLESSLADYLTVIAATGEQVARILPRGGVFDVVVENSWSEYRGLKGSIERIRPEAGYQNGESLSVPEGLMQELEAIALQMPRQLISLLRSDQENVDLGLAHRETLIWSKASRASRRGRCPVTTPRDHQEILRFFKWDKRGKIQGLCSGLPSSVLSIAAESRQHLAQGDGWPIRLPMALIDSYQAAPKKPQVLCNPWVGTGATLIAAARMGWHCIGIDLHCGLALERYLSEVQGFTEMGQQLSLVEPDLSAVLVSG